MQAVSAPELNGRIAPLPMAATARPQVGREANPSYAARNRRGRNEPAQAYVPPPAAAVPADLDTPGHRALYRELLRTYQPFSVIDLVAGGVEPLAEACGRAGIYCYRIAPRGTARRPVPLPAECFQFAWLELPYPLLGDPASWSRQIAKAVTTLVAGGRIALLFDGRMGDVGAIARGVLSLAAELGLAPCCTLTDRLGGRRISVAQPYGGPNAITGTRDAYIVLRKSPGH